MTRLWIPTFCVLRARRAAVARYAPYLALALVTCQDGPTGVDTPPDLVFTTSTTDTAGPLATGVIANPNPVAVNDAVGMLAANDIVADANTLTIDLPGSTPADGSAFNVTTGRAVVTW